MNYVHINSRMRTSLSLAGKLRREHYFPFGIEIQSVQTQSSLNIMLNIKRSRNNSESPIKINNDNYSVKRLCKSPLLKNNILHNSIEDYKLMFANEDSFDNIHENIIDKENNTNITNSPVKLENNDTSNNKLDLSKWQRCRIIKYQIDPNNYDQIVKLRNEKSNNETICRLQGPWSHTKLEINESISILAKWCSAIKCFVINKDFGFVVTNPDFLISATSVVGSLFCRRKAVLQDKFRGIDSDNKIMVIGSIVHELFQIVLRKNLKNLIDIEKVAYELLQSQDIMLMLYSSKLNKNEAEDEIHKFLPNIVNFVDQYVYGNKKNIAQKDNIFQDKIDTIQDIEENVWIPQFGLKGKIDVSVKVHEKNKIKSKLMPLELKTGKASFSMEHKGQVILYQMMLNELDNKIESGLLLYLKDGIMKEITSTRNEQRDLIMLRNDLAYYLNQNISPIFDSQLDKRNIKFDSILLPEPINHYNACSKCPYNTVCSSFMLTDHTNNKLPINQTFDKIAKNCTEHLTSKDLDYFIFWCGLLSLEEKEIKKSNKISSMLWTDSPEERRNHGRAIINLKLNENVNFSSGKYIHNFIVDETIELTQTDKKLDFTMTGISLGDYVIVSSTERIAIAAGHVFDLQKTSIKLSLERNLLQNYNNNTFIIDKHDSKSGMIFNYTNLGILIENTELSKRLRDIVIDNREPTFTKQLPKKFLLNYENILINLNKIQRLAVMKALTTNDYMLIKGLPGTGKTQTLVAIIRLYHLMGKSILITSHTHSAVDNLLIRLKQHNLKFLRLGAESRINPELTEYSESSAISNCNDPDDLARIYSSFPIVGVTCLGTSHSIFTHRKFDICIVDEATQVYQPTILRPLFFTKKFILVGDPDQLPPLVRSKDGKNLGADQSLFHRLDSPAATSILTYQYRMNKTITKLANDLTYAGKLECADKKVSIQSLFLPKQDVLLEQYKQEKWILRTLEKHIDQSVILLDTKNCFQQSIEFGKENNSDLCKVLERSFANDEENFIEKDNRHFKYTNYCDASIVFSLVKALLIGGYSSDEIGIIAPYRAQVELLKKLPNDYCKFYKDLKFDNLEVNTVDQYQGRDKKVILYSCTKTGNPAELEKIKSKENEILEDRRRLTVAITRSKLKLVIIGDEKCLTRYTPFKDLFGKIPGRCKIVLEDGKLGFSWQENLKLLKDVMN